MSTDEKFSRRTWLRKTVLFTAAVGAPALPDRLQVLVK
jgi:hypothetical protein